MGIRRRIQKRKGKRGQNPVRSFNSWLKRANISPEEGTHQSDPHPPPAQMPVMASLEHLANAPSAFIQLYRNQRQGPRDILKKLIWDERMEKAREHINKRLNTQEEYRRFFRAIIDAMLVARRGVISPLARRHRYEQIEKSATALVKLIAIPHSPPLDGSGYRGELDLQAYDLLPHDVATVLEGQQWAAANNWAYSVLCQQMRIVDLLKELAAKAKAKLDEPWPARRRSRTNDEIANSQEEADKEIGQKTRARLFACHLDDELSRMKVRLGPEVIRAIISVVYDFDLDSGIIRKALSDHRKKCGR